MDPNLLTSFLTAYECGSIQQACVQLNVSQPSLSRRLQRLEDLLDVRLFERTPRGLVPTIYGNALAARARLINTEMDLARREIEHIRSATGGWVNFGVSPGVAGGLMPGVVRELTRDNPALRLTIVEGVSGSLVDAVSEGKLEFAVCSAPSEAVEGPLQFEHIIEDPIVVVAGRGHPLLDRNDVPLAELLHYPWAMATFTGYVRQWIEAAFLGAGLTPPAPQVETSSMVLVKQLLLDRRHLSCLPAELVRQDFPDAATVQCDPRLRMARSVSAVYLRHRGLSPTARMVVNCIARQATARSPRTAADD